MKLNVPDSAEYYHFHPDDKFTVWEYVCPHPRDGGSGDWAIKGVYTGKQLAAWHMPPWKADEYAEMTYRSCGECYAIPINKEGA